MEYTQQVAEFITGARYERIPPAALAAARQILLDSIGVALAGNKEVPSRICARQAREEQAAGKASLFGHGFKSSAATAALVNGTSTHALDYDASFVLLGQPTAGLTAAVFAQAQALGASGAELLAAFVVGFEVTAKLARSAPELSTKANWHSTATVGSLGAAAACAKLLQLDSQATPMALGIAVSMASGVVWNFGTMTKPLHAGLGARNGVLGATLARDGFTANASLLEEEKGFLASFGRGTTYDPAPLKSLGNSYELVDSGAKFKAYPCGGLTHSAIDAALEIKTKHDPPPDAIERIKVAVAADTYERIAFAVPKNGLEGKFSMGYIVARALLDGAPTVDTFTDEAVRDPAVLALAQRVEMKSDARLAPGHDGSRPCEVQIRLKGGHALSNRVDYPKGSAQSPMTEEDLRVKFRSCAQRVLSEKIALQALEMLDAIEELNDISPLCALLSGNP